MTSEKRWTKWLHLTEIIGITFDGETATVIPTYELHCSAHRSRFLSSMGVLRWALGSKSYSSTLTSDPGSAVSSFRLWVSQNHEAWAIIMKAYHSRRLLAVLAHPDDESFGPGGTLALYASRGVDVHLICATSGEAGEVQPELLEDYDHVQQLRLDELRCAAEILGLNDLHLLGYRDSGMPGSPDNLHPEALAAAPVDEVAGRITTLIRQIRPQVILTFDPQGGYRHPDHIAVHHATVSAFHAAGDPSTFSDGLPPFRPQKLYYHVLSQRFLRWVVLILPLFRMDPRRWGRNADIDLVEITSQSYPVHARIKIRSVLDAKGKAAACHKSQSGPPASGLLGWLIRLSAGHETFMRAHPPAPEGLRERDLFEGITEE
jgi:LmbE family N-acetylglucosaminyl deacetylase